MPSEELALRAQQILAKRRRRHVRASASSRSKRHTRCWAILAAHNTLGHSGSEQAAAIDSSSGSRHAAS